MAEPLTTPSERADQYRALLAAIVDSSDDAIVSKTLDGIITSWNRGAETLFGYTAAEAVGQPIFLIIPEDRIAEEHAVLGRLRRGDTIEHFETVRRAKGGRDVFVSLTVSPIRDARGQIIGASKVARDIGERRRHDELRARLAAIVDSSDDAIIAKTLDGTITAWNRGAEMLFGYTAAEAVGQPIFLIIPEDRVAEEHDVLARLRRGEKIDHFETIRRAKNGRAVHISLTVSPIRDAEGHIIGASKVARDIGDRIRAQRIELLTRIGFAEEHERRRIARELHDQIGQHLTALRLTLAMLKSQPAIQADARSQIATLDQLAQQLDRDVAFRVWELRAPELDAVGLQAALTDHVRSWAAHFGITAHMHASGGTEQRLSPEVETTMYRLAQEALNNVAKHARADRVDVVLERHADHLSLIVEDNGEGFEPLAFDESGRRFGLLGMRERAALVGAELQIESTPGGGTTVVVRAPLARPASAA